jgi:copper chaperone CopZ
MSPAIIESTASGISCASCKDNIESGLASEPGIQQLSADVGARRVRIAYDPEHTSPAQLRERLSEIGYPANP